MKKHGNPASLISKINTPVRLLLCAVFFACVLAACGSSGGSPSPTQGQTTAAEKPTAPALTAPADKGKSFTLLIYMVGSDLESLDGAASSDLKEIMAANPSGGLRVLAQTGGATRWYTDGISSELIQRYEISGGQLKHLEDTDNQQMSDPACLHDFLAWGIETAPADRYGVILWNHGAGTILGYGFDEYYPDESLSLADLYQAFSGIPAHFAFVGFDACLMGTLETAVTFSPYADYLIASEEYEPSTGWFYTDWVKQLNASPGIDIRDLGRIIVDDYVSEKNAGPYDPCTLSLLDLSNVAALYAEVRDWFGTVSDSFQDLFVPCSQQRSHVKSFGGGNFEQVDLLQLLENDPENSGVHAYDDNAGSADGGADGVAAASAAAAASVPEIPERLKEAAKSAILYTARNRCVDVAGGLAFYYPYIYTDKYNRVAGNMEEVGYEDIYFRFYDSFVTTLEQGHVLRAEAEEKQDALGLVRAAGKFEPEDVEMPEEELLEEILASRRRLHAGHVRVRRYNEIYNLPEDEKELVTDLRLLQLNRTGDGYVYVGKEGGNLTEYKSSFDLSGGHYLSVGGRLVSYTPEYDSEASETNVFTGSGDTGRFTADPVLLEPDDSSAAAFHQSVLEHIYANDIRISEENRPETDDAAEEGSTETPAAHEFVRYGYVDALLNGTQNIRLRLYWDENHPEGLVAGYREIPKEAAGMHNTVLHVPFRGLRQLKPGDELEFVFYHFDEDAQYDGTAILEEPIVVGEEPLTVALAEDPFALIHPGSALLFAEDLVLLSDGDSVFAYRITDVYHNIYYIRAEDAWDPDKVIRFNTEEVLAAPVTDPMRVAIQEVAAGFPAGTPSGSPGGGGNTGTGGNAGNAGNGGNAGNAGNGGSAGNAGNGGSAGNAGNAGNVSSGSPTGTNVPGNGSALPGTENTGVNEIPAEWEAVYEDLWEKVLDRIGESKEAASDSSEDQNPEDAGRETVQNTGDTTPSSNSGRQGTSANGNTAGNGSAVNTSGANANNTAADQTGTNTAETAQAGTQANPQPQDAVAVEYGDASQIEETEPEEIEIEYPDDSDAINIEETEAETAAETQATEAETAAETQATEAETQAQTAAETQATEAETAAQTAAETQATEAETKAQTAAETRPVQTAAETTAVPTASAYDSGNSGGDDGTGYYDNTGKYIPENNPDNDGSAGGGSSDSGSSDGAGSDYTEPAAEETDPYDYLMMESDPADYGIIDSDTGN